MPRTKITLTESKNGVGVYYRDLVIGDIIFHKSNSWIVTSVSTSILQCALILCNLATGHCNTLVFGIDDTIYSGNVASEVNMTFKWNK